MDKMYRMKDGELSDTSRTWTGQLQSAREVQTGTPEPRSLAVADSFLNSCAAEPATASTTAGAIEYSSNNDFWHGRKEPIVRRNRWLSKANQGRKKNSRINIISEEFVKKSLWF